MFLALSCGLTCRIRRPLPLVPPPVFLSRSLFAQGVLEEPVRVDPVEEEGWGEGRLQRAEAQEGWWGEVEALTLKNKRVIVRV